ncbi:MAG: hypothetical protein ACRENI_15035, partial [Gemmatimonadaceae bacterium]
MTAAGVSVSARELRDRIAGGELAVTDAVEASFRRAADIGAGRPTRANDRALNLILWSDRDAAAREGESITKQLRGGGDVPAMAGVPIAVKDN